MKKPNPKFLLKLLQSISSFLMQEVDPDLLLELLQIASAIISLVAVSPLVGLIASVVAVYCLIGRSKDEDKNKDDSES
jgi:hypothetical protein